ncbi:1-acylglycerol-3-phosphate O-acyltransferase ABHD5 [Trichomycterus rosablanca]|uniref:1-acylglycerol-3-phosphate O-acyltransferase ABHD5 n=1 Tax=Trichomycterus rosablanca TaxID=2290929 RepID=UPI002F35252E
MNRDLKDLTEYKQRSSWYSSLLPSWSPSSLVHLKNAEDRILDPIKLKYSRGHVPISDGNYIWTLSFNAHKSCQASADRHSLVPLVLLHGFGCGVGLWVKNLTALAECGRPVHAVDLLGFGRSSRKSISTDAHEAEEKFIRFLEEWREAMGIELMILLGHDLGGYISTAYALKYPHRVKCLVLVEPWGFPERPEMLESHCWVPFWIKVLGRAMNTFNPLALLRVIGPLGPLLLQILRSDFKQKYFTVFDDDTVPKYLYHLNVQIPSGETAFKSMTISYGWAQRPMMHRIGMISSAIPISIICGSRSCIDGHSGQAIQEMRPNSHTNVIVIRGAGHYVFADQADDFNQAVLKICRDADNNKDARVCKRENRNTKREGIEENE